MNIFKGLIKCKLCGKNYNYKNDHGTKYYICSGYKNYGTVFCPRNQVNPKDLIFIINQHCRIHSKELELSRNGIRSLIEEIAIYGKDNLKIYWNDGKVSEWSNQTLKF